MRRVRIIAPSGPLLVGAARVALANHRFAHARQGHVTLRNPDERALADLRWLGVEWDAVGEPSDHETAIERLKNDGRLYPCFESETELRAKREYRIRRGKSPVYDRAMLLLTPEQRATAEANGKRPHWRFRLSNRILTWMDAISGRREAKLQAVSDPVLVSAEGVAAPLLAAVVDDAAQGVTHVVRTDEGDGMTGAHLDVMAALGLDPEAVTFAQLPVLGDTGRLAVRNLRHDGIEAEALAAWLTGERFNVRNMAALPDPAALPPINRATLARRDFAAVADRLPPNATEPFWLALRGHIDLLSEARHWWDVANGTIFPPIPEGAGTLIRAARDALPPEPWDAGTWDAWLAAVSVPGAAAVLRSLLTGEEQGPELPALLPLIGRARVLERLRGV